jgi:TctA family transporter
MELFEHLIQGFYIALSLQNLSYCLAGCLLGTLIGVLPGIGPVATIAMLLPITYVLPPTAGLIMLAGIYYGAAYGGSTTAILMALPGEISSVVTVLDGNQMARRGRAGSALAIAALGSFFAGCVATAVIAGFAPLLAGVALEFGPASYFSLMVLGLVGAVVLASGSLPKAICMVLLGLLIGMIGVDVNSGISRYDFGILELQDGIDLATVAMGVFGFAEIIGNLELREKRVSLTSKVGPLYPSRQEFKEAWPAAVRGTVVGSLLGILPGGGAALSSFAAYAVEKKVSKHPERFGQGHPAGVAGPESANNAGSQTSFIPLLTLGIPGNPATALMIGAMMILGVQPGPLVISSHPDLGADRVNVGRQPGTDHSEPPIGGDLGQASGRSLPHPVSRHPRLLRHWRVHAELQRIRHLCDGRLRPDRVCLGEAQVRGCAAVAGTGAGPHDGRELPPRLAALARRHVGLRDPPLVDVAPGLGGRLDCPGGSAHRPPEAGSCVRG